MGHQGGGDGVAPLDEGAEDVEEEGRGRVCGRHGSRDGKGCEVRIMRSRFLERFGSNGN